MRDLKNIWTKLRYVIIPKFDLENNPEAVKELRNCKNLLIFRGLMGTFNTLPCSLFVYAFITLVF
jgi:hypothetical protein